MELWNGICLNLEVYTFSLWIFLARKVQQTMSVPIYPVCSWLLRTVFRIGFMLRGLLFVASLLYAHELFSTILFNCFKAFKGPLDEHGQKQIALTSSLPMVPSRYLSQIRFSPVVSQTIVMWKHPIANIFSAFDNHFFWLESFKTATSVHLTSVWFK